MRKWLPLAVLLGTVVIAVASSRPSAQGQSPQAGITEGEKLSLAFEADGAGTYCTVIGVRGDFVGCRTESPGAGRPTGERWYNLRLIARIDRSAER